VNFLPVEGITGGAVFGAVLITTGGGGLFPLWASGGRLPVFVGGVLSVFLGAFVAIASISGCVAGVFAAMESIIGWVTSVLRESSLEGVLSSFP